MKFLFFLTFIFLISSVSAFNVLCGDEGKGVQIWNLEQTFEETGWSLEEIGNEEGLNCTHIESSIALKEECKELEPVIDRLNKQLKENYEARQALEKKLGRYKYYKWFSFIFIITTIILTIFLKLNMGEKNGKTKKR